MNIENTLKNISARMDIEKKILTDKLLEQAEQALQSNIPIGEITVEHAREIMLLNELGYYKNKANNKPKDLKIVYHYTDINGLHGIFKSYIDEQPNHGATVRKCTMRASEIKFLNDAEEYNDGKTLLDELDSKIPQVIKSFWAEEQAPQSIVDYLVHQQESSQATPNPNKTEGMKSMEEFEKDECSAMATVSVGEEIESASASAPVCEDIYCVCFCKDGDLKSQWQGYGKKQGVETVGIAIGFNLNNISCRVPKTGEDINATPMPVCYTMTDKMAFYIRCCMQFQGGMGTNFILAKPNVNCFAPYCKHHSFEEEQEVRLLFYRQQNTGNSILPDTYEVYYPNIKPTIDIEFASIDDTSCIVLEIIVGPGHSQNIVFNHLIHMFDSKPFHYYDTTPHDNRFDESGILEAERSQLEQAPSGKIFKIKTEKEREQDKSIAYKCANGIVIIKSSSPLREN